MHVVGKPRQPALVAAASTRRIERGTVVRSESPDAEGLFDLVDRCGPVKYAIDVKENAASKIHYYPARIIDPREEPEPIEDGPAMEEFDRLGDVAALVSRGVGQLSVTGECYLVGQERDDLEGFQIWSSIEWDKQTGYQGRLKADAVQPLRDSDFSARIWRSALRRRELPDSPLRSVAEEVEQLILLRGMVTAITWSRLSAKILAVPSELEIANPDPTATQSSFMQNLTETMMAAVTDNQSASRVVPLVIRGPGERLAQIEVIDLIRDMPEWVPDLMEKVLRQVATGLNLPAEILTGMGDINHWGQWLIDDSTRLNHVDPDVLLMLEGFSTAFLQPALEGRVPNPTEFVIWRDYSDLTSRTLTIDEAIALRTLGTISDEALRRIADLSDEDAGPGAPIVAEPINPDNERDIPDALVAAATPAVALGQLDLRLFTQISEASQAAVDRAMERAGAKIRTHTKARNGTAQQFRSLIDEVPNWRVGLTLGREAVETLQLTDDELVPESTFDTLGERVDSILRRGQDEAARAVQRLTGQAPTRDETTERTWRERAVGFLAAALTALTLRRFFTPDLEPDPAETGEVGDTDVPANAVWDTLTVAAGGEPGARERGLANGPQTEQWVTEAGATIAGKVWTVGHPTEPFEPHQNLSGVSFTDWDDPQLVNPTAWPGAFLYPGDHGGCQCVAVLVVEPE